MNLVLQSLIMIKFTSQDNYQTPTIIPQNGSTKPASIRAPLPNHRLHSRLDHLVSLIRISLPLHSLFTTPSTPSTSPKTQSRTSARTSSKAHPEAIHLVETVLKKTPIMSLHLRRHFHRITKLRQFSSQPAVSSTICFTTLLTGRDDSSPSSYLLPTHTTVRAARHGTSFMVRGLSRLPYVVVSTFEI